MIAATRFGRPLPDGIQARDSYMAGDPKSRTRDLEAMFADPEVGWTETSDFTRDRLLAVLRGDGTGPVPADPTTPGHPPRGSSPPLTRTPAPW